MVRGIQEELGIESEVVLTTIDTSERLGESESYPGLRTHYAFHTFKVTLTDEQFREEGYIEKQEDICTYFVWEEIESA